MKVAIYARYSSENQRDASIADQFRVCREFAQRQGWQVATEHSDHAVSGATIMRPGFQAMMREALQKRVDIVMAEALGRFSRDQEDTAGLFKRLAFAGVSIVTLAEGDITHLHIGLKGTMNALFLKELAEKTRRGLRGRIELGKAGGGVSFGYRIVRQLEHGVVTTGERGIVPDEAAIVRRISTTTGPGRPRNRSQRLSTPRVCAAPVERSGARARFTEIRSVASAFCTTSCTSVVWCGIGNGS
jgi:site-specific DNA recombinase